MLVPCLRVSFHVSEWRACQVIGLHRATHRSQSIAKDQTGLRVQLRYLAAARVRDGYRRLHILLQREGWRANHQRVYRLYRLEGLSLRFKSRKKRPSHLRVAMPMAQAPA
jgi:putative transposase